MVSSQEKSENSPLYYVHTELDSFILCNDESFGELELEGEHGTQHNRKYGRRE